MPPAWLTALAWAALAIAFAGTAWITCDIYGRGYRQHMRIMEPPGPLPGCTSARRPSPPTARGAG